MSSRTKRQGQNHGTNQIIQKDYGLNELIDFIKEVQVKAKINGSTIEKVTGKTDLLSTQIRLLKELREFHRGFLTEMEFDMCFLDLKTVEKGDHQVMAKSMKDAFRMKAGQGGIYENHNAWVINIFCYDELERPTPFALAFILLERLIDRFCSELAANGEMLEPFKVTHHLNVNVEPGFQQSVEILRPLVEQIFKRLPNVSLNFIISGITANDPSIRKLAALVLMLGRLIEGVRLTRPRSRISCIFCGNDFFVTGRSTTKKGKEQNGKETFDVEGLLGEVSGLAYKQGNRIEGQDQTLKSIMDRMLILRWSAKNVRWLRTELKGTVTSDTPGRATNA